MVGHAGPAWERQFPLAGAENLDAVNPMELGHLVSQTHLLQVTDRAGGQAVAARLVTGKFGLVQHDYPSTGLGCLPCRGGACRPTARDCQVVLVRHASRLADGISTPNSTDAPLNWRAGQQPTTPSEQVSRS